MYKIDKQQKDMVEHKELCTDAGFTPRTVFGAEQISNNTVECMNADDTKKSKISTYKCAQEKF